MNLTYVSERNYSEASYCSGHATAAAWDAFHLFNWRYPLGSTSENRVKLTVMMQV